MRFILGSGQELLHIRVVFHDPCLACLYHPLYCKEIRLLLINGICKLQHHILDTVIVYELVYTRLAYEIMEKKALGYTGFLNDHIGARLPVTILGKHLKGSIYYRVLLLLLYIEKFRVHTVLPHIYRHIGSEPVCHFFD